MFYVKLISSLFHKLLNDGQYKLSILKQVFANLPVHKKQNIFKKGLLFKN